MADPEIFVFILGDPPASRRMFSVVAPASVSVSLWKDSVYTKKQNHLEGYDAADLILWKLDVPIASTKVDEEATWPLGQDLSGIAKEMLPADDLSDYFPGPVLLPRKHLHVIVQLPSLPSAGEKHGRSEDDGDSEHASKRKKGPRLSGPEYVFTDSTWSKREDTVAGILELLHAHHLVQVRGTPASGKTTLMNLLHAHIVKTVPDAQDVSPRIYPGYPYFENGERHFIFDEGQSTYWDTTLWVTFKDNIQSSRKHVYAILFCSYGNKDVTDAQAPTPLDFGNAKVTLDRTDRGVSTPLGLLLDEKESREVIKLRLKLHLADELRDFVYFFTRGHAGAIVAVVKFLLEKRESSMLNGVDYCLKDFRQDAVSCDEFCQHLSMDTGIARGIPKKHASHEYAEAMRALLVHGSIHSYDKTIDQDIRDSLHEGYKRGFVNIDEDDRYTFASPLHRHLWSWRLLPQDDCHLNLYRIASHRPLEARYQDKYYRCVYTLTQGNVRITPEYAAATGSRLGRIDFFILSKKWSIELTREGDRLRRHNAKFAVDGAYGQWLESSDMEDYVLLDFRSTMPARARQDIKKLYFMVFSEDKTKVKIYDNKLDLQHTQI